MHISVDDITYNLENASKLGDIAERIAVLESYGAEPENGTVMKFRKPLASGSNRLYAAIRVRDGWYLAGSDVEDTGPMSWADLGAFAASGDAPAPKLVNLTPKAAKTEETEEEEIPETEELIEAPEARDSEGLPF